MRLVFTTSVVEAGINIYDDRADTLITCWNEHTQLNTVEQFNGRIRLQNQNKKINYHLIEYHKKPIFRPEILSSYKEHLDSANTAYNFFQTESCKNKGILKSSYIKFQKYTKKHFVSALAVERLTIRDENKALKFDDFCKELQNKFGFKYEYKTLSFSDEEELKNYKLTKKINTKMMFEQKEIIEKLNKIATTPHAFNFLQIWQKKLNAKNYNIDKEIYDNDNFNFVLEQFANDFLSEIINPDHRDFISEQITRLLKNKETTQKLSLVNTDFAKVHDALWHNLSFESSNIFVDNQNLAIFGNYPKYRTKRPTNCDFKAMLNDDYKEKC